MQINKVQCYEELVLEDFSHDLPNICHGESFLFLGDCHVASSMCIKQSLQTVGLIKLFL